MYYNTILQLLASLTNVIGTTYAVLSILKLEPNDLYQSITIGGMDKNDEALLVQKKQARVGISFIVYAWIMQIIFSFFSVSSCCIFWFCMFAYIVTITALGLCLFSLNKRFTVKYYKIKEKLDKEDLDRHKDCHEIINF